MPFRRASAPDDGNGTGPDDSGGEITQQESVEMLEALAAVGSFSPTGFGSSGGASLVSAAAVPVSGSFDESGPRLAERLTTSMDFASTPGGSVTLNGSHQGTLSWSTSGESGSCNVDVTFDFSGSQTAFSGSVSGTVCGYSVSQNLNVG